MVKSGAQVMPSDRLLWYIAFNQWVLFSIPEIYLEMEDELRSGRLAYLLPRPVSYLGAKFSEGAGLLLLNLSALGLVTFFFNWFWTGSLPCHPLSLCPIFLFGILAGLVALLFQMAIGLTSFWIQEVGPCYWIWEKLLYVLGGLILPLSIYPLWLQKLADWTPFPVLLGKRSFLALDFHSENYLALLMQMTLWAGLGIALLLFLFHKGLRTLTIEGG
ncbi:MAG: hypothetical protein LLG04_11455 [Parachlamydia sp.]|nr:hypothetical protein [Parachlamydia sp.]